LERPMGPLKNNEVIRAILSCNKKYRGTRNYYFIKKVGEGGFSSVYEVRHKVNGKIYAMKLMDRAFMTQKGKIPQVILEKNIMQSIDHPFILKSYKSFATVL
jgi:RAC serine/threonine-protein kinase